MPLYRFTWRNPLDANAEIVEDGSGETPALALQSLGYRIGNRDKEDNLRDLISFVVVVE